MRVITFSRYFPASHPRKGEPTFFVEKLNKGLGWEYGIAFSGETESHFKNLGIEYSVEIFKNSEPKFHTIRSGDRWKVGDKFSPRIWSGKPYASKQIEIAPPIEIKKIWNFEKDSKGYYSINGNNEGWRLEDLARNDGLTVESFDAWFYFGKNKNGFNGQILCWNENINY